MNAARRVHAGSIGAGARFWGSQARRLCRSLTTVSLDYFIGEWGFAPTEQNSMILSPYSLCLGRICHDIIMIR